MWNIPTSLGFSTNIHAPPHHSNQDKRHCHHVFVIHAPLTPSYHYRFVLHFLEFYVMGLYRVSFRIWLLLAWLFLDVSMLLRVSVFLPFCCCVVFHNIRLPRGLSGKESTCQCRRWGFDDWVGKIPWRRAWQPTPLFLPGDCMDRGASSATVHGVVKESRHKLVSKQFHDINLPQFVYPFFCWWILGLFPVWGYYSKAAVNICIQVFVWTYAFISFLWTPGISWGPW